MTFPIRASHYSVPSDAVIRTKWDPSFEQFRGVTAIPYAHAESFFDLTFRPENLSLVSSIDGKMARLLLLFPKYLLGKDGEDLQSGVRSLISKLPNHTTLDVVVNESNRPLAEELVASAGRTSGVTFHDFDDDIRFSIWAEDAYAIGTEAGATYMIEPYYFRRHADSVIADYLAFATDLFSTTAPLYFQGGNILVGDDFFLVGKDYPVNTLADELLDVPRDGDVWKHVSAAYRRYLDPKRKVLFPGANKASPGLSVRLTTHDGIPIVEFINRGTGTHQPIFHIDMFITLAGRGRSGKYEVFVGSTRLAEKILGQSYGELGLGEQFDQVAQFFINEGFDVTRNPLPLAYKDYQRDGGSPLSLEEVEKFVSQSYGLDAAKSILTQLMGIGASSAFMREWYFATSNNVLTEVDGDRKAVWLPQYGFGSFEDLAAVDGENERLWSDKGFEVIGLGDFHPFAHGLGAAHCIKKYLARETAVG